MSNRSTVARSQGALDQLVAAETQRLRRGHRFSPTSATWAAMPHVDDDGVIGGQALVVAHYFGGPVDLWLTGMDDDGIMRGFIRLTPTTGAGKWGLISARELETLNMHGGLLVIERELHWAPIRACEIAEIVEAGGAF